MNFKEKLNSFYKSPDMQRLAISIGFIVLMTTIVSSQNFFFQNIVEHGISKRDIIAQKTIHVVDVKRTEQHKKEAANRVDSILVPAEDDFIKTNMHTLQQSILQIRKKNVPDEVKEEELGILFDITNSYRKDFTINFLLKSDEQSITQVFQKADQTLNNALANGITESDYENNNIEPLIMESLVKNISKPQSTVIKALLEQVIVPNLVVDDFATDIARKNAQNLIKPTEITFRKGDKILFEGEPVTRLKLDALRQAGYNIYELNFEGIAAIALLITLSTFVFLSYINFFEKKYLERSYLLICATLSVIMAAIASLLPTGFPPYVLPLPAYIMIITVFTSSRIALTAGILLLLILTLAFQFDVQFVITFTFLSFISSIAISCVRFSTRFDLIRTGLYISLGGLLVMLSVALSQKSFTDTSNSILLLDIALVVLNGIASSIITLGTLPLFENVFKIITPYGLAELADHNQPLLKRLQFEAPGTYHHSLMVSNLAEAAAEAIGADPILARVGAFYHDIGKLKRPLFFVENQAYFGIENPHQKLNPRASKMVVAAHPKDGVELAAEYGVPSIVKSLIIQHHGDGLAGYFFARAKQEEGEENVKEEEFRYTGPKPASKEAAILMIADATESAVRAAKNPTPEETDQIIDKIIKERLDDKQLSESPLTLKDLKVIAATFARILRGVQHKRIEYQQTMDADLEKKIQQLQEKENKDKNA
jgi:putative nucleotidyltransferase with HDIG domain